MNSNDVLIAVITAAVTQLGGMLFGFGKLFQRVKDHGDRLDRLEEHEDQDRKNVWSGLERRRRTGHL